MTKVRRYEAWQRRGAYGGPGYRGKYDDPWLENYCFNFNLHVVLAQNVLMRIVTVENKNYKLSNLKKICTNLFVNYGT